MAWVTDEEGIYAECDSCGDEVPTSLTKEDGPHFCSEECEEDYNQ